MYTVLVLVCRRLPVVHEVLVVSTLSTVGCMKLLNFRRLKRPHIDERIVEGDVDLLQWLAITDTHLSRGDTE